MAEEATTTEQVQNAETARARRDAAQINTLKAQIDAAAGQHARRGSEPEVHEDLRADVAAR